MVQTKLFFVIESKETCVIYVMLMCMLGPFTTINIGVKVGIQKFKKMMNYPTVPCLQCRLLVSMEGIFVFKIKKCQSVVAYKICVELNQCKNHTWQNYVRRLTSCHNREASMIHYTIQFIVMESTLFIVYPSKGLFVITR